MTMGTESQIDPQPYDAYPAWEIYTYNMLYVTAEFTMRNLGSSDEIMKVMFPLSALSCYESFVYYQVVPESFAVSIDGQKPAVEEITTDNPNPHCDPVRWATFEVVFPVNTTVHISIAYKMQGYQDGYGPEVTTFWYLLESGAAWRDTIGSVDITFVAPYSLTQESAWGRPTSYQYDGNQMQWHWENLEPTSANNIQINIINKFVWEVIIEQRNKVAQNPEDDEAWFTLAQIYSWMTVTKHGVGIENLHLANLAEEAFQKATQLEPDSAEYHRQFAYFLASRCMAQAGEANIFPPTTEFVYCAAAAYEADIALALEPDNHDICKFGWVGAILGDENPCSRIYLLTPSRSSTQIPTITPTKRPIISTIDPMLITPINTPTKPTKIPIVLPVYSPTPESGVDLQTFSSNWILSVIGIFTLAGITIVYFFRTSIFRKKG
ncbi:MAG: hypothetical protein HY781_02400 [Chloroflexi bacterium]|nr:hypothetical protein [Chloroflexota bacterium]